MSSQPPGAVKLTTQPVILTQPQQVVMVQPQIGQWQTGLCDCFSDMEVCLYGTFCSLCMGCEVANAMNESCFCASSPAMRSVYRTRYNIPGSICHDFFITSYFGACSLCQITRDIRRRKTLGIF